jgi:hypothetical protein
MSDQSKAPAEPQYQLAQLIDVIKAVILDLEGGMDPLDIARKLRRVACVPPAMLI